MGRDRLRRSYFALFTAVSFIGRPLDAAEIFRTPDVEAALYFATIILTDPPTSPAKYPDQIVYGLIVAVISFAVFETTGVVYYLLAGLLAANVWEAWRRVSRRTGQSFPGGIDSFVSEILGIPIRNRSAARAVDGFLMARTTSARTTDGPR